MPQFNRASPMPKPLTESQRSWEPGEIIFLGDQPVRIHALNENHADIRFADGRRGTVSYETLEASEPFYPRGRWLRPEEVKNEGRLLDLRLPIIRWMLVFALLFVGTLLCGWMIEHAPRLIHMPWEGI